MPTASDLKSEVAQLKSEAEAPRRARKPRSRRPAAQTEPAPADAIATDAEEPHADLKALADKLSHLVEDAETEIKERPVPMVLGAFALGIVVGALLRR